MNIPAKKRLDVIVILVLLSIALVAIGILLLTRRDGEIVSVEIDGERVAEYSLSKNGEYPLNGGTNILVIEDGGAYMKWADCPDGICVRTGRVSSVGESIVCLPNRVVIIVLEKD